MLIPSCSGAFFSLLGDFFGVTALFEGGYGLGRAAQGLADAGAERAHIGGVGIEEDLVGAEYVAAALRFLEACAVDQERLSVSLLQVHYGEEHGFYLGFDVVRLVDHVVDARLGAFLGLDELDEDQEQLEGVDASHYEVVISVLPVVEVETSQTPLVEQKSHDVLYVYLLGVVPEVYQDFGPLTEPLTDGEGGAPVGQVGVVEGGLVGLVLEEHPHVLGHGSVDLAQRLDHPVATFRKGVLAGVVRAVGEP